MAAGIDDQDAELKRSLFASIEASPIAAVVTDRRLPDNPIVAANAAFLALTGYSRSEILGRNCRFLGGTGTDPAARAALGEAVRDARPALVELLNYRKDGSHFRNAVMIAPVFDAAGEIAYFLGSQMDVTKQPPVAQSRRQERSAALVEELTPRQRQVLHHMVQGLRNKQIAALLAIDEKTVKMHRARLLQKLGAGSSADAIRIGVEAGVGL
jgi:PAS domain S-box-containing protein